MAGLMVARNCAAGHAFWAENGKKRGGFGGTRLGYTGRMTTRQALHDLVDDLPEDVLGEAERSLARLKAHAVDPVLEALRNAPVDDEPLTARERARNRKP